MTKKARNSVKPRPKSSGIGDLVQVVRPNTTGLELALPVIQTKVLRQIVARTKGAATDRAGTGVLFAGSDATGKTLAAEMLAGALGRPLYRIDLAAVVSKYIGETEKNLHRLFDAAEAAGAILFFDEADALFGRRTEVTDSHDRFANTETNYLLLRLESHPDLMILTTNAKANLDPAFLRRLRYIVEFPLRPPTPR